MPKTVEYFYTHASPWAYLGTVRFHDIAEAAGAEIVYRPVSLRKIFPVSGGVTLAKRAEQRKRYRMFELRRWRDHLGVELIMEPKHETANDETANRMVIAADRQGLDAGRLSNAILRAIWAEERNIADETTLIAIADHQGIDGRGLLDAAKSNETAKVFETYTKEGLERQVFGAPTYIYKEEPFWGQDRLEFLERALALKRPENGV